MTMGVLHRIVSFIAVAVLLASPGLSFSLRSVSDGKATNSRTCHRAFDGAFDGDGFSSRLCSRAYSRRSWLTKGALIAPIVLTARDPAHAADAKILVLGGTGLVGNQIVQVCQDQGLTCDATSRDGRDGTIAFDFVSSDFSAQIKQILDKGNYNGVISCVGAIGTPNDERINAGTATVARAAKEANVKRFVYITVAPEVKEFAKDLAPLQGYMSGKAYSRGAVQSSFPSAYTLIEPTFIYGGDSFGLMPPRVTTGYGQLIESVLASGPMRGVEGAMPRGIFKIALEPPVAARDVARAAVAGVLGKNAPSVLDTHDGIVAASGSL